MVSFVIDKSTDSRTVVGMKTIGVTELRQRAAEVIESLREDDEPTLVLQRSERAAYLIGAEQYEAQQAELAATRRELFLREVRDAEAEHGAGKSTHYGDVESLLDDLHS